MDKVEQAIQIALEFGQIDGGHHKMWVIDQMLRVLAGDDYEMKISEFEWDSEAQEHLYDWDKGIPP